MNSDSPPRQKKTLKNCSTKLKRKLVVAYICVKWRWILLKFPHKSTATCSLHTLWKLQQAAHPSVELQIFLWQKWIKNKTQFSSKLNPLFDPMSLSISGVIKMNFSIHIFSGRKVIRSEKISARGYNLISH